VTSRSSSELGTSAAFLRTALMFCSNGMGMPKVLTE
jgi:hypothetical protein